MNNYAYYVSLHQAISAILILSGIDFTILEDIIDIGPCGYIIQTDREVPIEVKEQIENARPIGLLIRYRVKEKICLCIGAPFRGCPTHGVI